MKPLQRQHRWRCSTLGDDWNSSRSRSIDEVGCHSFSARKTKIGTIKFKKLGHSSSSYPGLHAGLERRQKGKVEAIPIDRMKDERNRFGSGLNRTCERVSQKSRVHCWSRIGRMRCDIENLTTEVVTEVWVKCRGVACSNV